jgi:hypothetical protein
MNTNINLDSAANSELAAALNGTFQALAAGLPDPAELARIANHFSTKGKPNKWSVLCFRFLNQRLLMW